MRGPSTKRRLVLGALGVAGLVVGMLPATISIDATEAHAIGPDDQIMVDVSGSLSAMSSSPSFQPTFSPSTHDYVIYCQSGVNLVTFTFGGVTPTSIRVGLGENQAAVIDASSGGSINQYWVRCLPHDFPPIDTTGSARSVPGWYLTGDIGFPNAHYAMVLDSNATPVWYQKVGNPLNVEALGHDTIAWMNFLGNSIGANPAAGYTITDLDNQTTRTLKAAIGPTDPHELYPMTNGDYMMTGTPLLPLATPFDGYSYIVDCVIQEVTSNGSLVWSWRASDYLAYGIHAAPIRVNGQLALDAFHCNSIDANPSTGQVLVSMRDESAVYLIQESTSKLLWKLNGCGSTKPDPADEPVLSIQGDPEGCFDAQHDARFQSNGDVSVYDDHTYRSEGSARGVEYSINLPTSKATFVQQFPASPSGPRASGTGSFRRYRHGTDNVIGWGLRGGSGFTEVDGNGNSFFSMTFPGGNTEYRVVKVPLSTFNVNTLRATAGLPRAAFPTVRWASLGGVITSKPGVATWSSNRIDVFGRGADGQLWHKWFDGQNWSNWEPLGGQLAPGTGPGVAAWAPDRLDVFVDGTNGELWHKWFDGQGWSDWETLGGMLLSGPAVASWASGRLDVVVVGANHVVYHKWFDAPGWSGWENLHGQTSTDPGIATWAPGRLDVFARGTDNQLWHKWFDGLGWSDWQSLDGNLTTGPAAASLGSGLVDAVAAGSGGEPERLPFTNGLGWQVWQPLTGTTAQPPAVVAFDGREDVFVTGTDDVLYFGPVSPS